MFGISVLRPGCGSVNGTFQLSRAHMGPMTQNRRARERQQGIDRERNIKKERGGYREFDGEKEEKKEKLCEKQGFTQHYITFTALSAISVT